VEPTKHVGGLYRITNTVNNKVYIGIAKNCHEKRLRTHIKNAKAGSDTILHRAIRKYGADKFMTELLVIAKFGEYLKELEVTAIKTYGTKTPLGYNMTDGGDGGVGMIPWVRQKIIDARKLAVPTLTDAGRKSISEKSKARWGDPEYRKRCSDSIKEHLNKPEIHKARCAKIKAAASSPKGRKIKSEQSKLLWQNEDYRNKVNASAKAGMNTPQAKINRSEAAKKAWAKRKSV
jgi:group I intron endonuclease